MPSAVRISPTTAPFAFDVLDCRSVGAERGPWRWRLDGRTADGRRLLLDFDAVARTGAGGDPGTVAAVPPSRPLPRCLTRATVTRTDDAWVIQAQEGRFDLGAVRLIVHEDVSAQAAIAVPPRPVPIGKRLFWRVVFALLATRVGRRWLERRAAA